jgi:hypothetical protein
MSKGGPREGSGRPRGSRGKRTRDSIAKAEALWPTSLEVLLESMPARTRRRRAGRGRGVRVNCGLTSTRRSRLHPPLLRSTMNQIIPCCRMRNLSQLEKLFSKGAAPTAIHVATSRPGSRPFGLELGQLHCRSEPLEGGGARRTLRVECRRPYLRQIHRHLRHQRAHRTSAAAHTDRQQRVRPCGSARAHVHARPQRRFQRLRLVQKLRCLPAGLSERRSETARCRGPAELTTDSPAASPTCRRMCFPGGAARLSYRSSPDEHDAARS